MRKPPNTTYSGECGATSLKGTFRYPSLALPYDPPFIHPPRLAEGNRRTVGSLATAKRAVETLRRSAIYARELAKLADEDERKRFQCVRAREPVFFFFFFPSPFFSPRQPRAAIYSHANLEL